MSSISSKVRLLQFLNRIPWSTVLNAYENSKKFVSKTLFWFVAPIVLSKSFVGASDGFFPPKTQASYCWVFEAICKVSHSIVRWILKKFGKMGRQVIGYIVRHMTFFSWFELWHTTIFWTARENAFCDAGINKTHKILALRYDFFFCWLLWIIRQTVNFYSESYYEQSD